MKLYRLILFICTLPIMETVAQQVDVELKWKIAGQLPVLAGDSFSQGVGGPISGIHRNVLLIGGGSNFPAAKPWQGGQKKYYDQLLVYTCKSDSLIPHPVSFKLPQPVAYSAACTTGSGVFFGGGENANGLLATAYLLQWDFKKQLPHFESLPPMPEPLTNAVATSMGKKIIIAGGDTKNGTSKKVWLLDLDHLSVGWTSLADLPKPAAFALLLSSSVDQIVYFIGGRLKTSAGVSELSKNVFAYNILSQVWESKSDLPYYLSAGTGVMQPDGNFILLGGEKGTTFSQVERLQQSIVQTTEPSLKQQLLEAKNQLLENHPGFSREILHYNTSSGICTPVGELPFETPVTTLASLWDHAIIIPSGEIRAGIRSTTILLAKPAAIK